MKRWPKIPAKIRGMGGMIVVKFVEKTAPVDGKETDATWDAVSREIEITKSVDIRTQWAMLFHELAHATWQDSGLSHFLSANPHAEEAFCDAVASARIVEMEG